MRDIQKIIRKISDIPPMPAIASKLLKLAANPETKIEILIDHIEKDQSLTAKMLKLCNSSYYGIPKKISSIHRAVVLLGFQRVSKLALTSCSSIYFKKGAEGYGLSPLELWRHSVGTAIASETIAKRFNIRNEDSAYTAGLLHDIGKVVLNEFIRERLEQILALVESGRPFIEAENEILGIDHGRIGGKLAKQWQFPESLLEAIKYHHEPNLAIRDKEICEMAHLGNIIINTIGVGNGVDSFCNRINSDIMRKYPLHQDEIGEIIEIVHERVEEAESLIKESITIQQ